MTPVRPLPARGLLRRQLVHVGFIVALACGTGLVAHELQDPASAAPTAPASVDR